MAQQQVGMERQRMLATEKIGRLMLKFAIPTVISQLVSSIYNIVDQIFIGQSVGYLGNAATTVAFPLVNICTAIALLCGIGGASNFNLRMGRKDTEGASWCAGNAITALLTLGLLLAAVVLCFLDQLLLAFGATPDNFAYAHSYTAITAWGIPFLIISTGGSLLVRADGSPRYAMVGILSGAILNVVLDALFIFVFEMGIAGAAWATVIGQVVSGCIIISYFPRFKSVRLSKLYFKPHLKYFGSICSLGFASMVNQVAITVVNITMNNTLRFYGELSRYGRDIPIACVGVAGKLNFLLIAFAIGIAQGCQPIYGYNYGAGNYARVRETYKRAALVVTCVNLLFFAGFQIFPRQIIAIFGNGSELYFEFGVRYLRIYMLLTCVNGLHPITGNFFTSIGKAKMGAIISLTRQFLFLLPLVLILPRFYGIDGVVYAGPVADTVAFILVLVFVGYEFRQLHKLEAKQAEQNSGTPADLQAEA